jgi:Excalibur calcium-binding domain
VRPNLTNLVSALAISASLFSAVASGASSCDQDQSPSKSTVPTIGNAPTPVSPVRPKLPYVSCREAAKYGDTSMDRSHPGYSPELDPDGDGVACEVG